MTEHVSRKRVNKMIAIFMVMTVYSLFLGFLKGMLLDQLLCIVMLDFVFFAMLTFLLENQRLAGRLCIGNCHCYDRF